MMIWDSNCPFRVSKSRRDSWIAEGHCSKRTGETENHGTRGTQVRLAI